MNYLANARSLGAEVFAARDEASLHEALAAARRSPRTCLIYVPISPQSVMKGFSWWDVPPAAVSGVATVRAARVRYDRAVKKERYFH